MKLIFLLLCTLIFSTVKSQVTGTIPAGNVSDTIVLNARYPRIVANINSLRSFAAKVFNGQSVYVLGHTTTGDGGGGYYTWNDTIAAADDNGAVIKLKASSGKGAFIHEVVNGIVNLKWWGVKAYPRGANVAHDISAHMDAAIRFVKRNSQWNTIYIPADTTGSGAYWCSRTQRLTNITVKGDGYLNRPFTRIQFPAKTTCFVIPASGDDNFANYVTMENLEIFQTNAGLDYGDSTAHGIEFRSKVSLKNIAITYAAGNAFHGIACAVNERATNYGNINLSEIINCVANFTNNGLYLKGCDANKIKIHNFDATAVRRWGVYDDGMLGNTYIAPHFAACGAATGSNVVVTYGGVYYTAINPDDSMNMNKRPDLYPAYWEVAVPMAATAWDSSKRYFSGGPIFIKDPNASSTILDPYFEEGEPIARLNTRSMMIGGTRGVGTSSGVDLRALFSTFLIGSDVSVPNKFHKLGIGITSPMFPLHIVTSWASTGQPNSVTYEEMDNQHIWHQYINTEDTSFFNVYGSDFRWFPGGQNNVLTLTPKEVLPGELDSTFNLGSHLLRWKNVHAATGNFGNVYINKLSTQLSSTTKMLVLDTLTKQVALQPTPFSRLRPATLIDAPTVVWNVSTTSAVNASLTLTGTNRSLAITGAVPGENYLLKITQDNKGSRTITNWPAGWKWRGGEAPKLTAIAGRTDIIRFYFDGSNYWADAALNYY